MMILISKYLNKLKKENYMINKNRADECFWLFSNTLPIGKNQTDNLVKVFGENLALVLPELMSKFSKVCLKNPEEFEGYLQLVEHMIKYIREESNENPMEWINIPEEEKEKMMKHMRLQIGNRKSE